MEPKKEIFLDTAIEQLMEDGWLDKNAVRSCQAARPPMLTAGDILAHLRERESFADVPGCRRSGRISDSLTLVAENVTETDTPLKKNHFGRRRELATELNDEGNFKFLSESQKAEILDYKEQFGHLPMFRILKFFFESEDATRSDKVGACLLGLTEIDPQDLSLSDIAQHVSLSRERVRQISHTYELPDVLTLSGLWGHYCDHSTYYVDAGTPGFIEASTHEVPGLKFISYARVLHRTTMLENVDDAFLARRGWVKEISAWVKRLRQMAAMPRTIDSRISLEGLTMGGTLDARITTVVTNQIAPALGIEADGNEAIILAKNR